MTISQERCSVLHSDFECDETFVHIWPHPLPHTFNHYWKILTHNGHIETANACIGANVNNDFHIPDVMHSNIANLHKFWTKPFFKHSMRGKGLVYTYTLRAQKLEVMCSRCFLATCSERWYSLHVELIGELNHVTHGIVLNGHARARQIFDMHRKWQPDPSHTWSRLHKTGGGEEYQEHHQSLLRIVLRCPSLDDIDNGEITLSPSGCSTPGCTATYSCVEDFVLDSATSTRNCTLDGTWSGSNNIRCRREGMLTLHVEMKTGYVVVIVLL